MILTLAVLIALFMGVSVVLAIQLARYRERICGLEAGATLAARLLDDERVRLTDAEERHTEIEARLREQVQDMATMLSSLRVHDRAVPEVERFTPAEKPAAPYSQQLYDFLNAIEYEGARDMVEEDIERLRHSGLSDEEIYQTLAGV